MFIIRDTVFRSSLVALWLLFSPINSSGDDFTDKNALLTVEGQDKMARAMADRILLVTVEPKADPNQDQAFIPRRYGQALAVERGNGPELLTSSYLVDHDLVIRLVGIDGKKEFLARRTGTDEKTGIASLELTQGIPAWLKLTRVTTDKTLETGTYLYFTIPAGFNNPVLGQTKVIGPSTFPYERLLEVSGDLPPGTPLFCVEGNPVAIAITRADRKGQKTLIAPLVGSKADIDPPSQIPTEGEK